MSMFYKTREFLDSLGFTPYMEIVSDNFVIFSGEVHWGENGEDVYNAEIIGMVVRDGDAVFINADNGCGETITYVFDARMEYTEEEWDDING